MPAENLTIEGTFTEKGDTAYKVEHYLQKEAGSTEYDLKDTEDLTGKTGAGVAAGAKTYEGYVFDEDNANNMVSGIIAADGSLVLKMYYKVDTISDIDDPNGPDKPNNIPDDEDLYTIRIRLKKQR